MTAAVGARNLFKVDAGVVHALLQARYYDGSKGEFLSEDHVFLGDPLAELVHRGFWSATTYDKELLKLQTAASEE